MITISDTNTTITLPEDMQWIDEFDWTPVEQDAEYGLTGSLIVQKGIKATGRPITMFGGDNACWVPRSKVVELQALLTTDDESLTLDYHGTEFTVIWDHNNKPLDSKPVARIRNPGSEHKYTLTLRFLEAA